MKRWTLLTLVVLMLSSMVVFAQSDSPPIDPALQEQMDGLDATTARLRGLKILQPVTRAFPSTAETEDYLRNLLDEELTPEILFEANQFYQAFDFVDGEVDWKQIYGDLLVSQVAGFYDPVTQTMNVLLLSADELSDELPVLEQILYVHEFTHALQDQHYALDPFYEDVEDFGDQALARQALVEGDASLVMQNFMLELIEERPLLAISLLANEAVLNAQVPEGVPQILENELFFPYTNGLTFATVLFNEGGMTLVDRAFQNPPQSTEQILHPERYLRGDEPLGVTLRSIEPGDVLGNGWDLVIEDALGEFYLREYLKTQLDSRQARNAAEGWGGDAYALFANTNSDQRAWVLAMTWDSADENVEFVNALDSFLQARYAGQSETTTFGEATCRFNQVDAFCSQHRGESVIITYAPDVELSMALLTSQTGD